MEKIRKKLEEYPSELIELRVDELHENKGQQEGLPANPRFIKASEFKRLKESIKNNPWGLHSNRIKINDKNVVLAGNQRLKAIRDIGLETVPVERYINMPLDVQAKLILMHNDSAGDYDLDMLANPETGFRSVDISQFIRPSIIELDDKLDQKEIDEKYTNANAIYPLIPVYDEKYNAFIIICKSQTEEAGIRTIFGFPERAQSYKNTFLGKSYVLEAKEILNKKKK